MKENPRAFDVAQKLVPHASAFMCVLDETRYVCHDKVNTIPGSDDPQGRHFCGEGIVGYFGPRIADA
jgi:hypothetical protein